MKTHRKQKCAHRGCKTLVPVSTLHDITGIKPLCERHQSGRKRKKPAPKQTRLF